MTDHFPDTRLSLVFEPEDGLHEITEVRINWTGCALHGST